MTDTPPETPGARYIRERLLPQVNWLEAKAGQNKQRFTAMNAVQVILPLLVPLLNLAGKEQPYLIAAALCGALASAAAAFSVQGRYRENWARYRTTASLLTALHMRYQHHVAPFDAENRDALLVAEAEDLIQKESSEWMQDLRQPQKKG